MSFDDVRTGFETRRVLKASRAEQEEMLAAIASVQSEDPAVRAQAREMAEALRQLMQNRRTDELRRPSALAVFATVIAIVALLFCLAQAYYQRRPRALASSTFDLAGEPSANSAEIAPTDPRTNLTISELAKRAPSLRTGTVQAWWVGEQARQVQRLEALAKRQALAGDREGAARTASRADAIRTGIPALADVEKPSVR